MAFSDNKGNKFTNADSMRSSKAMSSSKPMAKPVQQTMGDTGEEPEQVAATHGPATHVNVEHEHEIGSHHVHSVHPDGHEHHSDHGSAEEAHMAGGKLAGIGGEQPQDEEEGEEPWGKE